MTTKQSVELYLIEFARGLAIYGSIAVIGFVAYVLLVVDSYQ